MLRRTIILISVVALLVGVAVPSFGWKFASMADSRDGENGVNTAVLSNIVNRINAESVDFVIFQGDAVTGSSTDSILSSQMDTWLSVMGDLNCPWYYVPGNHEVKSPTSEDVLRTKVNQPLNGPLGHEELVYSFDHENAHFVGLNSDHYGEFHHVQRSWLATDLASTNKPHVFVMAHDPAYPVGPHIGSSLDTYPAERDDFWNILKNAKVSIYFCGHEHLYARSEHDNVYQVINGTCGAPISTAPPEAIGQHHYVVVEIDGYSVHCKAKNDSGAIIDSWDYAVAAPASISSIKGQPDGTTVYVARKTVTVGNDQFTSTFYIEEDDRSSGIKVYGSAVTVNEGDQVDVSGTISSQSTERMIMYPSVTVYAGPHPVPDPVSMLTRDVGGASLNAYTPGVTGGIGVHNTGLLIQVSGRVTYLNTLGKYFYVDDGFGRHDGSGNTGVLVHCGGWPLGADTIVLPALDTYVTVIGISSRKLSGGNYVPMIRPRKQSDIVGY